MRVPELARHFVELDRLEQELVRVLLDLDLEPRLVRPVAIEPRDGQGLDNGVSA
jgi:hypothetical protein